MLYLFVVFETQKDTQRSLAPIRPVVTPWTSFWAHLLKKKDNPKIFDTIQASWRLRSHYRPAKGLGDLQRNKFSIKKKHILKFDFKIQFWPAKTSNFDLRKNANLTCNSKLAALITLTLCSQLDCIFVCHSSFSMFQTWSATCYFLPAWVMICQYLCGSTRFNRGPFEDAGTS